MKVEKSDCQALNKQGIMPKIDKNLIIGISIVVILIFTGIISWTLFQKEKILPEKEVVPEKEEPLEEVLDRLTPAEPTPMTKEEKEELEGLLEQLTPSQPKPMTEEEKEELEKLLRQLTP